MTFTERIHARFGKGQFTCVSLPEVRHATEEAVAKNIRETKDLVAAYLIADPQALMLAHIIAPEVPVVTKFEDKWSDAVIVSLYDYEGSPDDTMVFVNCRTKGSGYADAFQTTSVLITPDSPSHMHREEPGFEPLYVRVARGVAMMNEVSALGLVVSAGCSEEEMGLIRTEAPNVMTLITGAVTHPAIETSVRIFGVHCLINIPDYNFRGNGTRWLTDINKSINKALIPTAKA